MGTVDASYSDLPLYALPLAAAIGLLAIPRGLSIGKRVRDWHRAMERAPGDFRPSAGHFEVETIGPAPTNLGNSSEPKTPSATPTLTSEPLLLQLVGGPRVRIAAGAKMAVQSFIGAQRRHLEATTTAQGIQTRISFEVPPGTRFFLRGRLAPSGDYRADAILDLTPIGGAYVVSRERFAAASMTTYALTLAVGCFFLGGLLGMGITMGWRTGCASGKHSVPPAALLDTCCIAAVLSMLGVHIGLAQIIPDALIVMDREQRLSPSQPR